MSNFTVSPTPLQVIGVGVNGAPLTVQNTGNVSIYISADPGVSPTSYAYKIDAGGDFIWPSGEPLSVCTGPGVTGQISYGGSGSVHVNSGSTNVTGAVTINGTVPISGPVTVSGSVGLAAGTVVDISGPVSISGGVSVTGSTINVGTVHNAVDQLGSYNTVIPASTLVTIYDSGPTGLLYYQSLIIIAPSQNLGASTTVTSLYVQWYDSTGTVVLGQDNPVMYSAGQLEYQVPIRGTRCIILAATSSLGNHNSLPILIYGSVYLLPRRYYSAPANIGQTTGLTLNAYEDNSAAGHYGIDVQPATASDILYYMPSLAGMANVYTQETSANQTNVTLRAVGRDGATNYASLLLTKNTAALTVANDSLIFPETPIVGSLGNTTGSRLILGITWAIT